MTVHVTTIDDAQIVFGLDWEPIKGEGKEKTEVRDYVREHSSAYQVRCAGDHTVMFGYLPKDGVPDEVKKPVFLSAAMLLATKENLPSRAMFLHIDTQQASLAIVENGVPAPGGDFHGSVGEAQELIRQVQDESQELFTIYSDSLDLYGNALPMTLSELLLEGDQEKAKLVKCSKSVDGKLVGLVAITVLFGVGFLGYQYYEADKKAKALAAARAKPVVDPNKLYADAVRAAFANVGPSGPAAATRFNGVTVGVETFVGGWALTKIDCTPETCIYVWDIKGGTNASFTKAMGAQNYQYAVDGTRIQYDKPLAKADTAQVNSDALPTFGELLLSFGSFNQEIVTIGMKVSMEPPSIFGDVTGINVTVLRQPIRSGKFSIEGPQALSRDVMAKLPAYTAVNAYHMKLEGITPTFKIEGSYYVKN